MKNIPQPIVDTNPVGRHGRIGIDILPRDTEYPAFDQAYVEQGMAIIATANVAFEPVKNLNMRPGVERPVESPGSYL